MWEYLNTIYNQENTARKYQLECTIAEYTQGNKSIQYFHSGLVTLWAEYTELLCSNLSSTSIPDFPIVHKDTKRIIFYETME